VLIVDDDPSIRELYTTLFVDEGYQVESARDGLEALDQLECKPDLIVLDLAMPRIDGHEFLRRLVRLPDYAQTPVLVVSAQDGDTIPRGASDVMWKPFEMDALLRRVSGMLAAGAV
jgi:CheY-like chemotaxis protein